MVTLIERYLAEDINAVRKQYSWIPEKDFDMIIRLDPTFNEDRDSVGKYGKWLLGLYKKQAPNGVPYSQMFGIQKVRDKFREWLTQYDNYCNDRTKVIEKDIMRFKSHLDLYNALNNVGEAELSNKQKAKLKQTNYNKVFDGNTFMVFVPKNHEGDMELAKYGGSSKAGWCTAADSTGGQNYYDHYLARGGRYYVIINKNDYEEKYQFHFESGQFMNQKNKYGSNYLRPVLKKEPKLWDFFKEEGYEGWIGDRPEGKEKKEVEVLPIKTSALKGARLLTLEEVEKLKKTQRRCSNSEAGSASYWWFTCSRGDLDRYVCVVDNRGDIVTNVNCLAPLGIRPAVEFVDSSFSKGSHFNVGRYIFEVIGDGIALCDKIVGSCPYNKDRKATNPSDYSTSDAKAYVEEWFNNLAL